MQNIIIDNISLILLLPLWLFLIIMGGRFFSVYVNKGIIYILTLLSSLLGALSCFYGLLKITNPIDWTYPFIKINDFILEFGLRVDKFSLIMGFVLFSVSFCVQLFSISYMKEEKKNYRFFALLNLFNFSMAVLFFSPNLFQMYVFWELIGVISYLLIGFNYGKRDKSIASKRVFLINRIGDTALISGIILTSYYMYNYGNHLSFTTLSIEDLTAISTLLSAYTSPMLFLGICLLFIIGAAVKSAQIPFYTWLQDAMRASLPVSALLHSATMVALGVYLIARLMPFFTLNELLLQLIFYVGLLTAIVCSILACIEIKPKKVLAYSTSANLGLMFMALGIANLKIALLLFISHAFIKSALFLSLSKKVSKISNQNFALFAIASVSLVFLMPAKEFLYTNSIHKTILLLALLHSAVYIFRLLLIFGKNRGVNNNNNNNNNSNSMVENFSALMLVGLNFVLFLILIQRVEYSLKAILASVFGILLVLLFNKLNILTKFSKTPKIMECINNYCTPRLYDKISEGINAIEVNIFSNYKPVLCTVKSSVKSVGWIEENVMNRGVNFVVSLSKNISNAFAKLQSGNVQTYNAYALIIITTVISFVIVGYKLIIDRMFN